MIETCPAPAPLPETTRRGLAIYEGRLKPLLEPEKDGQVVAIHVDSGEYDVARFAGDAFRRLRKRQPSGQIFLLTIGRVNSHSPLHRNPVRRNLPTE